MGKTNRNSGFNAAASIAKHRYHKAKRAGAVRLGWDGGGDWEYSARDHYLYDEDIDMEPVKRWLGISGGTGALD